jgi:hypothetical protein
MTYDSFHKNANQLYRVSIKDEFGATVDGLTTDIEIPVDSYLKKIFPEVRNATRISNSSQVYIEIDSVQSITLINWTDSSFLKMFDIKILAGNSDFMIHEHKKIAVTQKKSAQLFGDENPVGKIVKISDNEYTVGAVVTGYSTYSNYPFEILGAYNPLLLRNGTGNIVVELNPGIDMESFREKLYDHKAVIEYPRPSAVRDGKITGDIITVLCNIEKITLSPLTTMHYKDIRIARKMQFQHVVIFAVSGLLLILCTLFNYLALFAGRFRIRMHELALRIVCGASNASLFMLLSVEFLMSLIVALSFGVVLIYLIIAPFRELSGVDIELSFIYIESMIYIVAIILISLLSFLLLLYMFRRRALNVAIRRSNSRKFRRISIVSQLIISMVFVFCTAIILKQMYYLRNTDLGFAYKDRGCVSFWRSNIDPGVLENHLQQIPEIEMTVAATALINTRSYSSETYDWDERPKDVEPINMDQAYISEKYAKFYEFKLVAGDMLNDNDDKEYVMINESAMNVFGWKDPVGKRFGRNNKYIVKGVIENMCRWSFTNSIAPTIFKRNSHIGSQVLFKCREGTWETCHEKINQMVKEKFPDNSNSFGVFKEEINYDGLLRSENTLLTILTIISTVCIIVCVFGFVPMISLTCEERRKEIAIRKINGATVKDILDLFFKEYLTLLTFGALIAFPAGHLVMRRWLGGYVLQTAMSAWVYVAILLALMLVIVLCVGGKVYRTSRENPAHVVKS